MNEEEMIEILDNPEATIAEVFKVHQILIKDRGNKLRLKNPVYLYMSQGGNDIKRVTRYRESLQEEGLTGNVWFCPDYLILDEDIMSMDVEDYKELLSPVII